MSINGSGSKKVKINSFNEDVFFTLWFHSINFCLPEASICGDNQNIVNKKKVENTSTSRANKLGIGRVDVEKDPGTGKADKPEDLGISGADKPGIVRVDGEKNTGGTDKKKDTGRADSEKELGISRVNKPNILGRKNKLGIGKADKLSIGKINKLGIKGADKPSTDRADNVERQLARR